MVVFRDGKPLELTTREYELLTFLASHPNKVYSRIDLMEQVWNYGYVGDDQRTVDVTVPVCGKRSRKTPPAPNTSSPAGAWGTISRCNPHRLR